MPAGGKAGAGASTALRRGLLLIAALALVACAGSGRRPRIPDHTIVRAGDTLYSISQGYGLDYRDVARWNAIAGDYRIVVGQRLRLNPPPGTRSAATAPAGPRPPVARASPDDPAHWPPPWQWPVRGGRVIGKVTQPSGGIGLRIDGELNQAVFAAADGKVVYTGGGLRGYGQLVIINHARGWLSAYGHNALLQVREGDLVRAGQAIASMGLGPGQQPMLYFEIRLDGRPLDPQSQLPAR
ncbi:MAG TPA: peptidoglycan DD-metalloendopeptidase family protein [Steroidobacteraceae bacterium]|nr:peptidoglycan DD-metalloendopeptidase family protein [Steroidobacteraceae bacterium]